MIILLNGPPRCGKDTVGKMLNRPTYKMTTPMDRALQAMLNWSDETFKLYREEKKEELIPVLQISMRKSLQTFSEDWLKKVTDDPQIFGKLALQHLEDGMIITDIGFHQEAVPIQSMFKCVLVHIFRPGCTFEHDTREYIPGPDHIIMNTGTLTELKEKVDEMSKMFNL